MKIKTVGEVELDLEQIEDVLEKHISADLGRMKEATNVIYLWNDDENGMHKVTVTFDITKKEPTAKK